MISDGSVMSTIQGSRLELATSGATDTGCNTFFTSSLPLYGTLVYDSLEESQFLFQIGTQVLF